MDARTINNLEIAAPSAETRNLIARWHNIVKPGIYRQCGGRWKKILRGKISQKRATDNRRTTATSDNK